MKHGITFIELLLFIAVIFILSSIGSVFVGCSDNGVSNNESVEVQCDYTIRYYHPNVEEVNTAIATVPEYYKNNATSPWSFKDLYLRVISDDTVVYKNKLWTEEELNNRLNTSNLVPSEDDKVFELIAEEEIIFYRVDETNAVTYLVNELEKRKGELLNTSCHDAKYVTDEDYWI